MSFLVYPTISDSRQSQPSLPRELRHPSAPPSAARALSHRPLSSSPARGISSLATHKPRMGHPGLHRRSPIRQAHFIIPTFACWPPSRRAPTCALPLAPAPLAIELLAPRARCARRQGPLRRPRQRPLTPPPSEDCRDPPRMESQLAAVLAPKYLPDGFCLAPGQEGGSADVCGSQTRRGKRGRVGGGWRGLEPAAP